MPDTQHSAIPAEDLAREFTELAKQSKDWQEIFSRVIVREADGEPDEPILEITVLLDKSRRESTPHDRFKFKSKVYDLLDKKSDSRLPVFMFVNESEYVEPSAA